MLKVSAVFEIRIHSLPPLPEAEGKWFPSAPAARPRWQRRVAVCPGLPQGKGE